MCIFSSKSSFLLKYFSSIFMTNNCMLIAIGLFGFRNLNRFPVLKLSVFMSYELPKLSFFLLLILIFSCAVIMPNKCGVVNCKGNYNESNKCRVFKLPKVPKEKQQWLNAIPPPKDIVIGDNFYICENT